MHAHLLSESIFVMHIYIALVNLKEEEGPVLSSKIYIYIFLCVFRRQSSISSLRNNSIKHDSKLHSYFTLCLPPRKHQMRARRSSVGLI